MSQVTTVLVEDVSEKQGETNGKPWTRYVIKDGNGDFYSTFEAGVAVDELKGKRVEIEWEQHGSFRNLLRATVAEEAAETPPLATGEYVKGKEAPETQRAIHASVALERAVAWCSVIPERDVITEHGVLLVANRFYGWLRDRAEGKEIGTKQSPSSEVPL